MSTPTVHTRRFFFNSRNAVVNNNLYTFDIIDQTGHTHAMRGYTVFLKAMSFRYKYYQINTSNNVLVFRFTGLDKQAVIPPGSYTTAEFIVALEQAMTAVGEGFTFTVTLDTVTCLITISVNLGQSFFIYPVTDNALSTLAPLIGFTETTGAAASQTSDEQIDIYGPEMLSVLVDIPINSFNSARLNYKIAEIPICPCADSPSGELVSWSTDLYHPCYVNGLMPDTITFALVDNDGNPIVFAESIQVRFELWVTPAYDDPFRMPHYQ